MRAASTATKRDKLKEALLAATAALISLCGAAALAQTQTPAPAAALK
jgi:hypothetical protein